VIPITLQIQKTMINDDLNDANFLLYAAKSYDKPNCVWSEFEEDLNRIQYIKRLLTKYYTSSILRERLVLNHITIFYNVFGVEAATRMLFLKMDERDLESIKPFLIFLNYLPDVVRGVNGKDIITSNIKLDQGVIECLRKIK
jgi:hypothetical protein